MRKNPLSKTARPEMLNLQYVMLGLMQLKWRISDVGTSERTTPLVDLGGH